MEPTDLGLPQPMIGVGAIIFDDSENVLLIRRNKPPAVGQWSIPGGCQEPGETLVETAAREVLEETAIEISVGPIIAVAERIREGFHYVIIDFLATVMHPDATTPVAASDVSEARWVQISNLDNYDMVEGLHTIIKRVAQLTPGDKNFGLTPVDDRLSDFVTTQYSQQSTLNKGILGG